MTTEYIKEADGSFTIKRTAEERKTLKELRDKKQELVDQKVRINERIDLQWGNQLAAVQARIDAAQAEIDAVLAL